MVLKRILPLVLLVWISGCKKNQVVEEISSSDQNSMETIKVSPEFNYETVGSYPIKVSAQGLDDKPIAGASVEIFEQAKDGTKGPRIVAGTLNSAGIFEAKLPLATYQSKVLVIVNTFGIVNSQVVNLKKEGTFVYFNRYGTNIEEEPYYGPPAGSTYKAGSLNFKYKGSWNSLGVPNYLSLPNDVIDAYITNLIANSLPEGYPVPTYNPQYLNPNNQSDIVLTDSAEVYITFVHEGAGWKNALGYYTYPLSNPPQSPNDIDTVTILFPNVSFLNSGGGLTAGNKIKLGNFSANTGIGWFFIPNGWNATAGTVGLGSYQIFSNPAFNPEADPALKQHAVTLLDSQSDLLLIGFEDVKRDLATCDQDFNDAIFYVTANPFTAIETQYFEEVIRDNDLDDDGVLNTVDDYPSDPSRAFNNYYPAENDYASLVFEDLYPYAGDYDFNDMILYVNYNRVTNAQNKIVDVRMKFNLGTIIASYDNGIGMELNLSPSAVNSVSGCVFGGNYIQLASNGVEANQSKAVVIPFDHTSAVIGEVEVIVNLNNLQTLASAEAPPYNPFLISNGDRGREVHLAGKQPTSLFNAQNFGKADDATNITSGFTFKTVAGHPWCMHIPTQFKAPKESVDISNAYLKFKIWAESNGSLYPDWYQNNSGYRNHNNILP